MNRVFFSILLTFIFSYNSYGDWSKARVSPPDESDYLGVHRGGLNPYAIFDHLGNLHVTYHSNQFPVYIYAYRQYDWQLSNIKEANINEGKQPVLVNDSGDAEFIYSDGYGEPNKHITKISDIEYVVADFLPEAIDNPVPPVIKARDGALHIMYLAVSEWSVMYATNSSGSWVTETAYTIPLTAAEKTVFSDSGWGLDTSALALDFEVDQNGGVYAAFVEWHYGYDPINVLSSSLIGLNRSSGGEWIHSIISKDAYNEKWMAPEVIVDSAHNIHMSYRGIACPDICYESGVRYGNNSTGEWNLVVVNSEVFSTNAYDIHDLGVFNLIRPLELDLSINDKDEVMLTYIHGTEDNSAMSDPPIYSELRVVRFDECLPVSEVIYDEIAVNHNDVDTHTYKEYIDGAIDSNGLGSVVFYDSINIEAHVMNESRGIKAKACPKDSSLDIIITNDGEQSINLEGVRFETYVDTVFDVVSNSCNTVILAPGDTCFVNVSANLSAIDMIDYTANVESTLRLVAIQSSPRAKTFDFVIETNSLRRAVLDEEDVESGSGSGGGALHYLYILTMYLLMKKKKKNRLKVTES